MSNELVIWDDHKLQEIKKLFAPNLTIEEFQIFTSIGKSTGLNPFLRELWAVKYKDGPASIFVGRDGYRKSAQSSPLYDWHMVEAIYENDEFSGKNGEYTHTFRMKDRGKIVGAYALCQRKGSSRPNYVRVDMSEYNTGRSVWAQKPSTMIKKVAEAQVLRMTFQELFAGTYDESEQWEEEKENKKTEKNAVRKVIDMTPEEDELSGSEILQEIEDLYIKFSDQIASIEKVEDLEKIWNEIKGQKDFLGKDYINDLTERVKSTKKILESKVSKKDEKSSPVASVKNTSEKSEEADIEEGKEVVVDRFNQLIALIKSTTSLDELEEAMIEVENSLGFKEIDLTQHGVLLSHKGIMLRKFPKQ